ncbi:MAG: putative 4-mercaptohistidine N1-methyltransferase, partial [Verrucomicrobiae bacterium]|nr:putative 4-mercaptohistidine N1-methyltransferase [Verrucomicrobiae bacterium]
CFDSGLLPNDARALDIGCAVGRSSFELSRICGSVLGIDYSDRFIETANVLKEEGSVSYLRVDEGDLTTKLTARVPDGIDVSRVTFQQGDATRLTEDLGLFDALLAANLIDRLTDPIAFLKALPGLMNPGGQLVITSPYTWLEGYTSRQNWLGGFLKDGQRASSLSTLESVLEPDFVKVREADMPFLIREHARKFQWSVAQATIWIRKGRY